MSVWLKKIKDKIFNPSNHHPKQHCHVIFLKLRIISGRSENHLRSQFTLPKHENLVHCHSALWFLPNCLSRKEKKKVKWMWKQPAHFILLFLNEVLSILQNVLKCIFKRIKRKEKLFNVRTHSALIWNDFLIWAFQFAGGGGMGAGRKQWRGMFAGLLGPVRKRKAPPADSWAAPRTASPSSPCWPPAAVAGLPLGGTTSERGCRPWDGCGAWIGSVRTEGSFTGWPWGGEGKGQRIFTGF